MGPPVRVVCRGCLRSVELDGGGSARPEEDCPYCGQPVDSRLTGSNPTARSSSFPDADESALGEWDEATDWVAAWSRGSLGRLDRFQLRERLGDGGFGEVYLAYDPRLDRDVALKILREPNPGERAMERFFREARAAARLDHPNIVAVYDAGFDKGRCWVAYQRVSGRPLWRHRDHHQITPIAAARMFRDLARAVDYAHQRGVVHRDIKPANILVDDLGRPRLIDFGLARRPDVESNLTQDGAVVGTPAYMSPEQALGLGRQVDERSDVFSLGVILLETLTGDRSNVSAARRPDSSLGSAVMAALVPRGLDRILARATAETLAERYPTAAAFADDLDGWLSKREKARSRPSLLAVSLWAVAVVTATLGAWLGLASPSRPDLESGVAAHLGSFAEAPSGFAEAEVLIQADAPTSASVSLLGNLKKKRYHLADCEDVKVMSPSNTFQLKTIEEAETKGLRPCEHCRPAAAEAGDEDVSGAAQTF